MQKLLSGLVLSAISAAVLLTGSPIPAAHAQDAAAMSCGELWYARNAIYARKGYCFKTDRARSVFGAGCFPPFGALDPGEQARVNELQYWESRKGC